MILNYLHSAYETVANKNNESSPMWRKEMLKYFFRDNNLTNINSNSTLN